MEVQPLKLSKVDNIGMIPVVTAHWIHQSIARYSATAL